ncbi:MAG: carboxypeptidase-like regulatory domain-containing protein [Melioribacter sp.]|jgi:TonB-dependent receptor|uniref:TonB-dependent receptor n=1 Tax=Melioribacter sp. TaxID=2052167 RepID=UPI003BE7013E
MKLFNRLIIILFFAVNLYGQGNLKGVVTDSVTAEPLIGANVFLMGTSLGSATNIDGEYHISRIPAGTYDVKISYVGYKPKIIQVTIQNNRTLVLDIPLVADVIEGTEVTITAQAVGQVAAINQQLSSNTIINVVSEEKIQELPDANAAESIGRLPGVSLIRSGGEANKVILRGLSGKYLSVTVDGVRLPATDALERGLDLSTISQSSLAGIELYKALTPDKDADAIAGSINLVTKKAPEVRDLRFVSKGGYNGIMDSFGQYDFSLKYGERFFDNFLGVQVNGNIERKIRSNESIDISYSTTGENQSDYFISDLDLEFTDEIRYRKGAGLILDINTPDEGNIKLNTNFSTTTRDYLVHSRNYPVTEASVSYIFRDREQTIDIFSSALTGENNLFGFNTSWGLSFARSKAYYPYDYEIRFVEPSSGGLSGMMSAPIIKSNPEALTNYAYNNFRAATLSEAYYYTQDNAEKEITAFLDVTRDYTVTKTVTGTFKAGAKYRSKNRTNMNSRIYSPYYLGYWRAYEKLEDGSIVPKDFTGTYFEDFYQSYLKNPNIGTISFNDFLDPSPNSKIILDDFNMNPLINRDKLRQWYALNKNGINQAGTNPEYHNDPSSEANTYDITESVTSGYAMNTLKIGRAITMILGARIEHESHDYSNKYSPRQIGGFPIPVGSTRDTSSTYEETIVLPHLHLNIAVTDFMNVRLAAYRALARPDFNMRLLSYFAWREAETGGDRILILGNPLLKTAKAWNFEINTSFYGNRIGLFSVSAFYKQIEDMYHMLNGISTVGDTLIHALGLNWSSPHRGNYDLYVPYNSPDDSKVWGFEVDHQINFTWLPGWLKNFVLSYNFSMVKSETSLIGSERDTTYVTDPILGIPLPKYEVVVRSYKQRLENQPEFFGNVSIGYDIGGFSGRLSLFHQSEYYRAYSPSGRSDRIVGAFTRLDLVLKQKITDNITVLCNINNLTNIKEENLLENREDGYKIPRSAERYGITVEAGIWLEL